MSKIDEHFEIKRNTWISPGISGYLFLPLAGTTGLEPAISGLTGRHVDHYTTPPSGD
jgi:hypothetical protein